MYKLLAYPLQKSLQTYTAIYYLHYFTQYNTVDENDNDCGCNECPTHSTFNAQPASSI